jgi:hypothetical protein
LHEGAHTYKYNKRSIGISFIGNYMGMYGFRLTTRTWGLR